MWGRLTWEQQMKRDVFTLRMCFAIKTLETYITIGCRSLGNEKNRRMTSMLLFAFIFENNIF